MESPTPLSTAGRTRTRRKPGYIPTDPFLTAREGAAELGIGLSTFWKHVKAGSLPAPEYVLPRSPRWRRSKLCRS
jgi:predicted DNA-binding transcriptional regulator AlpA